MPHKSDSPDILEAADENPEDTGSVLDVYKNASYMRAGGRNS